MITIEKEKPAKRELKLFSVEEAFADLFNDDSDEEDDF